MRGVVSGGMVSAVDHLRLTSCFDFVIGTSAGALAGAYLLAGQPRLGTSIYFEDLTGREWLDYRRPLRGKPLVCLDFLIDEVMVHRKPLDATRILQSPVPLHAVATRYPEFEAEVLSDFPSPRALLEALRASARLPVVSGPPVNIGGHLYIDGSETQSIPASKAFELGATHLLILRTRPAGGLRGTSRPAQRLVGFRLMNRLLPGLGDAHALRAARYMREVTQLDEWQDDPAGSQMAYSIQIPGHQGEIGQLEQNSEKLRDAAEAGAQAVFEAFGATPTSFFRRSSSDV